MNLHTHDGVGTGAKVSSDVTGLALGTEGEGIKGEVASVEGVTPGGVTVPCVLIVLDELEIVAEPASNS